MYSFLTEIYVSLLKELVIEKGLIIFLYSTSEAWKHMLSSYIKWFFFFFWWGNNDHSFRYCILNHIGGNRELESSAFKYFIVWNCETYIFHSSRLWILLICLLKEFAIECLWVTAFMILIPWALLGHQRISPYLNHTTKCWGCYKKFVISILALQLCCLILVYLNESSYGTSSYWHIMPLWYVYVAGFMVLDCGKFLFFQFLSLCQSFIFCIKTLGFFF